MNQLSFPIEPSWVESRNWHDDRRITRARQERDNGIKKVSENNHEFLTILRQQARIICHQKGWVCSDDLREWADRNGLKPSHPNCWGAVFNKDFIPGEYIVSKQVQGHCNRIKKWVLK